MEGDHESSWKETIFYAAAWFICSLLLVLCLLSLINFVDAVLGSIAANISDHVKRLNFSETQVAIKEAMYFIGGIFACGMAIWIEYYFRKGEKVGKLVQRVARILIIEIVIVVATNVGVVVAQLV